MALTKYNNLVQVETITKNTSVNLVTITEDKLENILIKHIGRVKRSHDWVGATAFLVTVLATLFTSDFHSVLGIEPAVFEAVFIILACIGLVYLIKTLVSLFKDRDSVEDIIKDIKL